MMSTNIEFTPPTGAAEPVKRRPDHQAPREESSEDDFERLMILDYVRKPLFVKAVRVTESDMDRIAKWCGGRIERDDRGGKFIRITTFQPHNERQSRAIIGDWVTMTENGSVKAYLDRAFRRTFELLTEEDIQGVPAIKEVVGNVQPVAVDNSEVDEEKLLLKYLAKKILED